jgi:hypothetical protein
MPRSTASYCTSDMLSVTKSLLSQRRILVRMSRRGKALHQCMVDRCCHWMLWLQWLLDDSKVVSNTVVRLDQAFESMALAVYGKVPHEMH